MRRIVSKRLREELALKTTAQEKRDDKMGLRLRYLKRWWYSLNGPQKRRLARQRKEAA